MRACLIRQSSFLISASAVWGLLPILVKEQIGGDAAAYGGMVTAIGVGAVIGGTVLPDVRARLSSNRTVAMAALLSAAAMTALALVPHPLVGLASFFVIGMGWIGVLASINTTVQMIAPEAFRARIMSVYLLNFAGSMALGSAFWGKVAELTTIPTAMLAAAIGLVLGVILSRRWPVDETANIELEREGAP